jgi:DNA repair protein RadC
VTQEYSFDSITVTAEFDNIDGETITGVDDVVDRYDSLRNRLHERCVAGFLDADHSLLGEKLVGKGSNTETVVDVQEVVRTAALINATSVVLIHNHPSDSPEPTERDLEMTNHVALGLHVIGVHLFDHVILSRNDYHSMRENPETAVLEELWD